MTTIQKADKLIRYLKTTKKVNSFNYCVKTNRDGWKFLYYLNGFYNNSYFAVDMTCNWTDEVENIKILNSTDNFVEINNLLAKFGLKDKI
jgi:hypothetical protein